MKHLIIPILLLASLVFPTLASAQTTGPCQYVLGFKTLHDLDPTDVGDCTDNQAFAPNGDAQQHTTKGLMAWRKADNWTAFTNGYMTWLNGPQGLANRLNTDRFPWEAPAPAATPTSGPGAVLYSDSLSDPNAGQLPHGSDKPDLYTVGYVPGEYQVRTIKPEHIPYASLPGKYQDSTLAVDVHVAGNATGNILLLAGCRRQDDGSGYEFAIYPSVARFALFRDDGGNPTALVIDDSKDVKGGNAVNHIELTCQGSTISATVNGALVASASDAKFAQGRLTIGAGSFEKSTVDARFTNLVVTQR